MHSLDNDHEHEWTENIEVANMEIKLQLDKGTMCNVIQYKHL